MLRLDKVIKPWKESAALNDHINLYGFWNETAFLTKSGDVGMVLRLPGVDYESLDRAEQEYAVKRLEAALKAFGPSFHVYQYLFKSNRPEVPFAKYDDPVVETAIDQRRQFFEAKRDRLYQVEIFYAIVLEGPRSKGGVGAAFAQLFRDPAGAIAELRTQFKDKTTGRYIDHTEWHRCIVWGKLAEYAKTLKKGAHLSVEGELRSRERTDKKTGQKERVWEVRVASILKLDRAEKANPEEQTDDELNPEDEAA